MTHSPTGPPTPPMYPSPYFYAPPWGMTHPLAPARRAGVFMIVLGVLLLLLGGCVGAMGVLIPQIAQTPEISQAISRLEEQMNLSASIVFLTTGALIVVAAFVQMTLGVLVRGGGLGVVVTGIVFTSLLLLYLLVNAVAAVFVPGGLVGAFMCLIGAGLFGLQLAWLIQAARNAGQVAAMRQGYGSLWMGPSHVSAGYGYGYGVPPVPPPVVPPNPAAPEQPK
ncbi:MAG: hypothetical protein NZ561_09390 [Phycisphaerae bacterium]|nr:hypothetical protein [Phycisphaerae bacterium]MDW8262026.1 hypothetical protein [Phycisphaerales bacterium]